MKKEFENFAGLLAILAGVSGFAYAVSFVIVSRNDPTQGALLSGMFLLISGFVLTAVWVALYNRLKEEDSAFAMWALFLGVVGSFGMAIHGGYDLANAINPPNNLPALVNLPSQIDPRGLLTFGVGGAALMVVSWLMEKNKFFPKNLAYLGAFSALMLLILYFGRLIVLDPTSPIILYPVLINGFVLNPLFYIWLGVILRK